MSEQKTRPKPKARHIIFDAARGIMVIMMIISHTIDFFYQGDSIAISYLRNFTATVAFTGFILISGIVNYFAYIDKAGNHVAWQKRKLSIAKRTGMLLLSYYFAAFFSLLLKTGLAELTIARVIKVLLFIEVPTYTEFLLTFVLLGIVIMFFGRVLQFVAQKLTLTLFLGAALYIIGSYYYQVDLGADHLNSLKALFSGHDTLLRFPLLQYAPVYLLGLHTGYRYLTWDNKRKFVQLVAIYMLACLALLLLNVRFTWTTIVGDGGVLLQRWPPSIAFLFSGLIVAWCAHLVLLLIKDVTRLGFVKGSLAFLGTHALQFYLYHVLLLKTYEHFWNYRTDSVLVLSGAFFALMAICSAAVKFSQSGMLKLPWKFNLTIVQLNESRIWQVRHLYRVGAVVAVMIIAYFLISYKTVPDRAKLLSPQVEGITSITTQNVEPFWWNNDYRSMSSLEIKNTGSAILASDSWLKMDIDAQQLFSDLSGVQGPLQVVRFSSTGVYSEVPTRVYLGENNQARIYFQTVAGIAPSQSDPSYFLYYNGVGVRPESPVIPQEANAYEVILGAKQGTEITAQVSRLWNLKNYSAAPETVVYSVQLSNVYMAEGAEPALVAWLKDSSGALNKYNLQPGAESNSYKLSLPLAELDTGTYTISAAVENSPFISSESIFYVSDPLFVTWTLDWEGYDLSETNMQSIAGISNKYGAPITQYFNPRIFVANDISVSRRKYLVNWVKQRAQNNGDEIALHLHMHLDMITASGLEPKLEPKWGGRDNGHDVLTTAYDYAEFKHIIDWSLDQFNQYGLPTPVSYRAGGWFLDEENLRVLEDTGFKIDSSGREFIIYGSNQIPNPWKLASTTKPYHPSSVDQNVPGSMTIWELPNNGMDSTNNDFSTLKKKFDDNYSGQPLSQTQVVTYLSHPHWFISYDDDDMIELYEYMLQFKYDQDKGPVIYTTLKGAVSELENN